MVTISVDLNLNGMSKQRVAAVMPVVNSVYEDRWNGTGRYVRATREFDPSQATKEALGIIKQVPEATVELRKGTPASLTQLTHGVAPKLLGTAMRVMKYADDYGIRLVPDRAAADRGVLLNGKPATEAQLATLNMDWRLAFDIKGGQAYLLLERTEAQTMAQIATLKDSPELREVGFTTGVFDEIRNVLEEHGLKTGMQIEGLPLHH